jgi:hypothetical protein
MGRPKKQTSNRKTGLRRSHLVLELARKVNSRLSHAGATVRAKTTKRAASKKAAKTAKPAKTEKKAA